eukprot:TRINITY_DN57839_c0_g1_i1.p1 TRINITY_DN57839_c0_g1~~TRINITY_DN57839_c0_g1_i1.p1  ORF type:complete len:355 (-),score=10.27 TRINITY_DN57839_c0_g1_i1:275-1339(-)
MSPRSGLSLPGLVSRSSKSTTDEPEMGRIHSLTDMVHTTSTCSSTPIAKLFRDVATFLQESPMAKAAGSLKSSFKSSFSDHRANIAGAARALRSSLSGAVSPLADVAVAVRKRSPIESAFGMLPSISASPETPASSRVSASSFVSNKIQKVERNDVFRNVANDLILKDNTRAGRRNRLMSSPSAPTLLAASNKAAKYQCGVARSGSDSALASPGQRDTFKAKPRQTMGECHDLSFISQHQANRGKMRPLVRGATQSQSHYHLLSPYLRLMYKIARRHRARKRIKQISDSKHSKDNCSPPALRLQQIFKDVRVAVRTANYVMTFLGVLSRGSSSIAVINPDAVWDELLASVSNQM